MVRGTAFGSLSCWPRGGAAGKGDDPKTHRHALGEAHLLPQQLERLGVAAIAAVPAAAAAAAIAAAAAVAASAAGVDAERAQKARDAGAVELAAKLLDDRLVRHAHELAVVCRSMCGLIDVLTD